MCYMIKLNGYSNFISMWKISLTVHISCKGQTKRGVIHELGNGHVLQLLSVLHRSSIGCIYTLTFVLIMDKSNRANPLKFVSTGQAEANSKCTTSKIAAKKAYFNAKNNHIMNHEGNIPNTYGPAKQERLLSQDVEPSCPEKSDCGPSKWQRRDSFSSCSSDSAVYCSSRHTQVDAIAQDVMKKKLIAETNGKKRQRNSSGSSALSSASDSSNKDTTTSHVADILSCLGSHTTCSEQDFPQLSANAISQSQVSNQSSASHYPSVVTSQSEIATIVEEKTVSFSCKSFEKSPPTNDRHHNLRQRIRKKTCHNCDCGGPHTTVYVRRYTHIKRETTTKHSIPKVKHLQQTSPSHHGVVLHRFHVLPKDESPVRETSTFEEKTSPSSPQERANRKRRTEIDKLYDALHEIKWAKHISPDNILSQIDFRRAAKLSFYSSKNKTESPSSEKNFKSPESLGMNHINRINCGRRKFVPSKCTYSLRRHGSIMVHNSAKRNGRLPHSSNRKLRLNHSMDKNKRVLMRPVSDVLNDDNNSEKLAVASASRSENQSLQNSELEQIESFRMDKNLSNIDDSCNLCSSGTSSDSSMTDLGSGSAQSNKCVSELHLNAKDQPSAIEKYDSLETTGVTFNNEVASPSVHHKDLPLDDSGDVFSLSVVPKEMKFWNASETAHIENTEVESQEEAKPPFFDQSEHHHVMFESFLISPKEGDIVIEGLHPDIIDIETSDVCYEEDIDEVDSNDLSPIVSPPLPLLTKVTPLREHSSDEGPPLLEPCHEVSFSNCTESFAHTLNETECSESSINVRPSDSEEPNHNHAVTETEHGDKSLNAECAVPSSSELKNTGDNKGETVRPSLRRVSSRNHRTVPNPNLVKKNLFKKYFSPTKKGRLKDVSVSSSSLKTSVDKRQNSGDLVAIAVSDSNVTPKPQTISTFGEEDRNNLIKNDSLRVRLKGLDQVTVRNHLQHYNSVFECKAIQSVTCSSVQTSSVQTSSVQTTTTSRKSVQFNKKKELRDQKDRRVVGKRINSACALKLKEALPLEDCSQIPQIPNFKIHYRFITVNKNDGYTQVIFKLTEGANTYLTAESLNELRDTLYSAGKDSSCQVLIVNSIGRSFCLGLDLRPLLGSQKNAASKKMAVAVKDFIEALAAFNKPLVIVVNGAAVGLGVTMLAYSDLIISSDAATFHMPYSRLGFSPEGGATLVLPLVVGSTVAMDMLLRGRTLSAHEACDYGLVSEVLTASQLPLKLIERVRQLAESPSMAMETTKSMVRMHLYQRLSLALESETAMLQKQWLSESCQSALEQAFINGSLI